MNDETNKQYLKLALILSFVSSFLLNFLFFGLIQGPFFGGFPMDVSDASGAGEFFARIVNSITMGILFIIPMFYFLQWLQKKSSGL